MTCWEFTTTSTTPTKSWNPSSWTQSPSRATLLGLCWITSSGATGTQRSLASTTLTWPTPPGGESRNSQPNISPSWSELTALMKLILIAEWWMKILQTDFFIIEESLLNPAGYFDWKLRSTSVCWVLDLSDWLPWQWLGSEHIFWVFHSEAVLRGVALSVDLINW